MVAKSRHIREKTRGDIVSSTRRIQAVEASHQIKTQHGCDNAFINNMRSLSLKHFATSRTVKQETAAYM